MKAKIIIWLLSLLKSPIYTNKEKAVINRFKSLFHNYFEGVWDNYEAVCPMSISSFGITNLEFSFSNDICNVIITLQRPGLLIGKGGEVIDGLKKYLGASYTINIKESKLWHYLR